MLIKTRPLGITFEKWLGARLRCVASNSKTDETGEMLEDPLFWLLVLPGLLLGAYAQWQIKANVAKYSQLGTKDGITGAEVARKLLDSGGLQAVSVEATPGMLTDHYDPRSKILRLSQDVYFTPSVAAALRRRSCCSR